MPGNEEMRHSLLIVSASEPFSEMIRRAAKGFGRLDFRKSVAAARRAILETYYDLVVISWPMPDETGEQFAVDITHLCGASVLLAAPPEVSEDLQDYLTDRGILVIEKPLQRERTEKAVRFLAAVQNRMHELEKRVQTVEEKMEEIRIVSKAKLLLVEKRQMTEDEAHRLIGREAMNNGVSRKRIAEQILDDLE